MRSMLASEVQTNHYNPPEAPDRSLFFSAGPVDGLIQP